MQWNEKNIGVSVDDFGARPSSTVEGNRQNPNSTVNNSMNMTADSKDDANLHLEPRAPFLLELEGSYWKEGRFDFKVRLHFHSLLHLMTDSVSSIRLYELSQISRPGDIWRYLWVEIVDVPGDVRDRVARSLEESGIKYMRIPWPENFIPLIDFDKIFHWCGDDTGREDECWLSARESALFRDIAEEEFAKIRKVQHWLARSQDTLISHEISTIATRKHSLDYIAAPAIKRTLPGYRSVTVRSSRSPEYYDKLSSLLSSPEVESVSSFDDTDFGINRLIFAEQRRRANALNCAPLKALLVCLLSDGLDYVDEWGSAVHYFQEGLGDAVMFIDSDLRDPLAEILQKRPRRRCPLIFSHRDGDEIEGYANERGNGWVLYRKTTPDEHGPMFPPK